MSALSLLGPPKVRVSLQLLRGERTAGDVASALRIQVSAARKHLEGLKAEGLVTERFERAARGRPRKLYALTEAGRELFPRRYDAVLSAVLARLVKDRGAEAAESFLGAVAADLAPKGGGRPLLRALNALGFEAAARRDAGGLTIVSRNCPILKVAQAHREIVCRGLHAGILRVATGRTIRRGKWIVDGDPVCTHVVD